jgi:hypothetical protein
MKKVLKLSLLGLSLLAGTACADSFKDQASVYVDPALNATVIGHVYDANGNIIGSYAEQSNNFNPAITKFESSTQYVYLGATQQWSRGNQGSDASYTGSCFDVSNGAPIDVTYSSVPAHNNFNSASPPTCPTSISGK